MTLDLGINSRYASPSLDTTSVHLRTDPNPTLDSFPEFMTVTQVASVLQMSENTVRSLLNDGVIPGKKLAQKWIVPKEGLRDALKTT